MLLFEVYNVNIAHSKKNFHFFVLQIFRPNRYTKITLFKIIQLTTHETTGEFENSNLLFPSLNIPPKMLWIYRISFLKCFT